MELKEAVQYLKKYDQNKVGEIEDKISDIKSDIDSLEDDLADKRAEKEELEDQLEDIHDNIDTEEGEEALRIVQEAELEVLRIEQGINSGLFKISDRLKEQLKEFKITLK